MHATNAARDDPRQKLGRKVQPRRRCGHRAFMRGVNRLIVRHVALVGRPAPRNVRRQRHYADIGDRPVERGAGRVEAQYDLAAVVLGLDNAA